MNDETLYSLARQAGMLQLSDSVGIRSKPGKVPAPGCASWEDVNQGLVRLTSKRPEIACTKRE
jgi:hypothetical protein